MKLMPYALALGVVAMLAGCGSSPLPSLSTGSLVGGSDPKKADAAQPAGPVAPADSPINRAFQVGSVSARATKCGFNFDAAKIKASFLAAEAQAGTTVEDLAKAEKIYNVSFNGVLKAAASRSDYCTDKKSREIKGDLALLLAGNYSPQPIRPKDDEDEGLLSVGGTKFSFD